MTSSYDPLCVALQANRVFDQLRHLQLVDVTVRPKVRRRMKVGIIQPWETFKVGFPFLVISTAESHPKRVSILNIRRNVRFVQRPAGILVILAGAGDIGQTVTDQERGRKRNCKYVISRIKGRVMVCKQPSHTFVAVLGCVGTADATRLDTFALLFARPLPQTFNLPPLQTIR
jgi:hypothetical protein